jgi:exopolyphosphatase/guanosine-5'-triphosphate,3'-diphosphate pyrophosphatase
MNDGRWPEVEALLQRYEQEPEHVEQVARLADEIFVGWQSWHQASPQARGWLQTAALLHDIGWSQTPDGKGHHKWSARLIADGPWSSLPEQEVRVVAQVARYHRKALPSMEHEDFRILPDHDQHLVQVLAGILRVADGLDRTHRQIVENVVGVVTPTQLQLTIKARGQTGPEVRMAKEKGDLVELVSGRELMFGVMAP